MISNTAFPPHQRFIQPQHSKACLPEHLIASLIELGLLGLVVMRAIDLNDQLRRVTHEVHNVPSNA